MISPIKAVNPANPVHSNSEDAPMTDEQAVILARLCEELGEPMDGNLSEADAARRIAALEEMKAG